MSVKKSSVHFFFHGKLYFWDTVYKMNLFDDLVNFVYRDTQCPLFMTLCPMMLWEGFVILEYTSSESGSKTSRFTCKSVQSDDELVNRSWCQMHFYIQITTSTSEKECFMISFSNNIVTCMLCVTNFVLYQYKTSVRLKYCVYFEKKLIEKRICTSSAA